MITFEVWRDTDLHPLEIIFVCEIIFNFLDQAPEEDVLLSELISPCDSFLTLSCNFFLTLALLFKCVDSTFVTGFFF